MSALEPPAQRRNRHWARRTDAVGRVSQLTCRLQRDSLPCTRTPGRLDCVTRVDNIDAMYTPPSDGADEPEHIARYLWEPIAATWRAFDRGRATADDFFAAGGGRPHDPHLHAHLVRYGAVLSLKLEPESPDWTLRLRHHSGIEVVKEPFKFKVCKAIGDGPQAPGRNKARRQFFQQLNLSLFSGASGANLILYWRVMNGDLDLGLCKPKGLWPFKGQPQLEWQQPINLDPLEGLVFPSMDDEDVAVFRLDESDLGQEEPG